MPDKYPLLPLPAPERGDLPRAFGGGGKVSKLSPAQQKYRLGPKFERLQKALNAEDAIALRADPSSIVPERALVLEVYKSIEGFYKAAEKIPGLEFLSESEDEFQPDDAIHKISSRVGDKGEPRLDEPVVGRVYLVMPDARALKELLRLWKKWQGGAENLGRGFAPLREVFSHLYDIRPWGTSDRLVNEAIDFLRKDLEANPTAPCRVEVELWYSENEERRRNGFANIETIVSGAGGRIIDHVVIENIRYDAALIELPAVAVEQLVRKQEVEILLCDDVMFICPQSLPDAPKFDGADFPMAGESIGPLPADDLPRIAALLDGVPVQNHRLLSGRIGIDDPNDLEAMSIVAGRGHGTAMASLIIHGDRHQSGRPISRKLHVCPVMYAPADGSNEIFHGDRLLLDVIYQAVKRMKEGDGSEEATAPDVFLVNLSLGDARRPFSGAISPWGRLLDYLADRYGILFLVSAGNIYQPLAVGDFSRWTEFKDAEPQARERAVLKALSEHNAYRTLLSPSESLNVITVGAQHQDTVSGDRGAMAVDPLEADALPNISSALGLGHRKVVKPDIYMPGGREHVHPDASGSEFAVAPGGRYGIKSAVPSSGGPPDREGLSKGTSPATALATRASHLIFEALMDASGGSNHADMDPQFYAVVVKALLVHQAKWGESANLLEQILKEVAAGKSSPRRDNITRVLGYGFPQIEAAISCTANRATLVGYGRIRAGQANVHKIPLPSSLERVSEPRSIATTVAWISPVNVRHQEYRRAKLHVDTVAKMETAIGAARVSDQPLGPSSARGTIFHARYEGAAAVQFVDDGHVCLRVTYRREKAGSPLDRDIRYGVAVTIEAGQDIRVYEEIQMRLAAMVVPR